MGARTTRFLCGACGAESLKWEGRCAACGAWNTLREAPSPSSKGARRRGSARHGPGPSPVRLDGSGDGPSGRRRVGLGELDLLLGGGLVPGSLTLLGGPPGIGKSTLLLQVAGRLAGAGGEPLYASGEESARQVRLRAARLGDGAEDVLFLGETCVERLESAAREAAPSLLCVDSVQSLRSEGLSSAPGGVHQVRECAEVLRRFAKETDTPTVLVGHVTKDGALAGPRALEHLVDVVLHFEGPRSTEHRLLRSVKNRFGPAGEVAVFRMTARGLAPVTDPATAFLRGRPAAVSGSVVAVAVEGSRPLVAEVQALTAPSRHGTPRRRTSGFPAPRLAMLLAVLERRAGVPFGELDVFVNVVGGLRLADPGTDLAAVAALASAARDRAFPEALAFVGEVGLGGEVREVGRLEARLREVARAGLKGALVPEGRAERGPEGLQLHLVSRVSQLLPFLDGDGADRGEA